MRLLRLLLFSVHFLPRNLKRFLATVLHSVTTVTNEEELELAGAVPKRP
jgi:hypothetical protein